MDSIAFASEETKRSAHFEQLTNKIKNKTARVGVVGLGYVGLPLAVEYANEGYSVTGIDLQASKVDQINKGISYIQDVPTSVVERVVAAKKLRAAADFSVVAELDTINICVPTPLRKTKDPDMSYIVSACEEIAKYIHPGMLVILESTTYPGTTDELVRPMLEKAGVRGRRGLVPLFLPGTGRSRQPEIPTLRTFRKWSAEQRRLVLKSVSCSTRRRWKRGAGEFHTGCRNGEAA